MAKILSIVETKTVTKNNIEMQRFIFSDDKIVYVRLDNDEISPSSTPEKYINLINVYNASHEHDQEPNNKKTSQYVGVRGWLVVLVVSLFLSSAVTIFNITRSSLSTASYTSIELSYPGLSNALKHFITFESFILIILAAISVITAILILSKNKSAKILFTVYATTAIIWAIIDTILATNLFSQYGASASVSAVAQSGANEITRALVYGAIWIPYIWSSKRVRATLK